MHASAAEGQFAGSLKNHPAEIYGSVPAAGLEHDVCCRHAASGGAAFAAVTVVGAWSASSGLNAYLQPTLKSPE